MHAHITSTALRRAAAIFAAALVSLGGAAVAQTTTPPVKAPSAANTMRMQQPKKLDGYTNQPAPLRHQAKPPSERLAESPSQLREQVAPVPERPIRPGSSATTTTTAKPDPRN